MFKQNTTAPTELQEQQTRWSNNPELEQSNSTQTAAQFGEAAEEVAEVQVSPLSDSISQWDLDFERYDSQPEVITVERVVGILTQGGAPVSRGPGYWLPPWLAGIGSFVLLLSSDPNQLGRTMLFAGAIIIAATMMRQASTLEVIRTALKHSHLDKRHWGALCEALEWPDSRVRQIAARLLANFLPRLREGESRYFTKEQLNCLNRRLATRSARKDAALTVSILSAAPIIGSESTLASVEHLAKARDTDYRGFWIRGAAQSVLPRLEQRVAAERNAEEARIAAESVGLLQESDGLTEAERQQHAEVAAALDAKLKSFESELQKVSSPGMRIGFLLAAWGIIVPCGAIQSIAYFSSGSWQLGLLFGTASLGATQLYRLTLTDKHKLLANRLGEIDDVRIIGRLCELLDWPDTAIRSVAIGALTRLLRKVKASDRVFQTPAQRATFYRNLTLANAARNADFLCAAFKGLEQIGDETAVPIVTNLANAKPTTSRERKVCDAASDCLPYLQQRAKTTRGSDMLLRASSATATGAEDLMRAASPTAKIDSSELLRADSGDDDVTR